MTRQQAEDDEEPNVETKITVIYENPVDPAAFEAALPELLSQARQLPGLLRLESARVWPKEDGSPTPAYRLLDVYFADYAAASKAVTTPAAEAFLAAVFSAATGGVRIVFADVELS
jgi:uncharacterized protein (TIGR02118 family)